MNLFYRIIGDGKPLFILHGLFGNSDNWQSLANKLANYNKVILVDQRNHGRSFHDEKFDYNVMVEDLENLLRLLKIKDASLMGHSMGGKTAMKFSLEHPMLVDKLIVVDISPRRYPVHHDYIIEALCALKVSEYEKREEVDKALAKKIDNAAVRQFLLKNLGRDSNHKLAWKINLPVIKRNLKKIVEEIKSNRSFNGPSLFIAGERSHYVKPADESKIRKLFPDSTITYFKNVGHWIHAEAPDKFCDTVSSFINPES